MDRRVTPPGRVTSPTWGSPPPCKHALIIISNLREINELSHSVLKNIYSGSYHLCFFLLKVLKLYRKP